MVDGYWKGEKRLENERFCIRKAANIKGKGGRKLERIVNRK